MKEKNPLDEYFKEGLEGHKILPSASVWDKIEAGVQTKSNRKAGVWLLLRAAMITIFLGLSTWVFYQNNDFKVGQKNPANNISFTEPSATGNTEGDNSATQEKGNEVKKGADKEEKNLKPEKEKKQNKVIPIMTQPVKSKPIYVKTEVEPGLIDESQLADNDTWMPESDIILNAGRTNNTKLATPVKVKIKLKPATTPAFYADGNADETNEGGTKAGFKERAYAYANNQFENLLAGKPLELPKPEKKPQLEIDLGRFFNN